MEDTKTGEQSNCSGAWLCASVATEALALAFSTASCPAIGLVFGALSVASGIGYVVNVVKHKSSNIKTGICKKTYPHV